jgi:predicted TIM-barrel fold metal-dependent hydrolase
MRQVPPFKKLKERRNEPILDPDLEIVDTHHHLFDRPHLRYMLDDYLEDARLGHRIVETVYVETQAFARQTGPETLRPIGEVEFANGVAAMCVGGTTGACRVAAAIVGHADMILGDRIAETLDRSMRAAPDRYRGVRQIAIAHPNPDALKFLTHLPPPDLLKSSAFRAAFKQVAARGLTFDAGLLHHQLPELAVLADDFPTTTIILNHAGLAMVMDESPAGRDEVFAMWRANMIDLARRPNVVCKIGGLGTSYWKFGFIERADPVGSTELAAAWKPFVETAIAAFGPLRCMMESNFPNDGRSCGFVPLWNALKLTTSGYSRDERAQMFSGTARRVYRLGV